jgi:thiosulfate/3-mercaptopyruvate sulfurtransferase
MSWQLTWILAASLATATEAKLPAKYTKPKLLIEAAELAKHKVSLKFRIVDVRGLAKYRAGHIAHAYPLEVKNLEDFSAKGWKKVRKYLPDHLGITMDTTVVVYGDDPREAARGWWLLTAWGVKDVRLLNGGWRAWQQAKGKTVKGGPPKPPQLPAKPGFYLIRPADRRADKKGLLRALKLRAKKSRFATLQVIDARSEKEFCGVTKLAKRGGAIPGAKHLEWIDLLDKKTQRFKTPAALSRLFKQAGIDLKKPAVTYCQSGGRAAVMAFGLELMGAKNVRNYYRSWAEWGNATDTPIEKGKPKDKK